MQKPTFQSEPMPDVFSMQAMLLENKIADDTVSAIKALDALYEQPNATSSDYDKLKMSIHNEDPSKAAAEHIADIQWYRGIILSGLYRYFEFDSETQTAVVHDERIIKLRELRRRDTSTNPNATETYRIRNGAVELSVYAGRVALFLGSSEGERVVDLHAKPQSSVTDPAVAK